MTYVDEVGTVAGKIWGFLAEKSAVSLAVVEKAIDAPRNVVYMAIGWLAREGKVAIERNERTIQIRLI